MKDPDSNLPKDPLDECLKTARWPMPAGQELNRLEARWDLLARERTRSRRRLVRWVLAATVLLAVGVGRWMLFHPSGENVIPPVPNRIEPRLVEQSFPKQEQESPSDPMVRPPTKYEQAVFHMIIRREQKARTHRQPEPLILALHQALNEPDADLVEACKPLQSQRAAYENWILSHIGSWKPPQQQAALQILREVGSPRAIPVLGRLSRDSEFAKHAWPVALHLAPANLLSKWARTLDGDDRKQAVQTLLSRREDSQALGEFLRLVASPASRKQALEAIQAKADPPVEALFAFLKQGAKEERHTAGLVLGRLATPEITRKLLALAEEQNFPPEVMIALLNSTDKDAVRFLNQAKQNPQVRASVQLACLEWELISYTFTLPKPLEIH